MRPLLMAILAGLFLLQGCYFMRGTSGGGETEFGGARRVDPADIALPAGYGIEPVAQGLTFPTGVAFDDQGRVYVVEAGYSYGEVFTTPRLLRIEPGGKPSVIASGGKNGPWTSVSYHQGTFLVAEGGEMEGGKILRITPAGEVRTLVEGLPSMGDHHTNGAITGPDGYIYFGQGTATNSGVVGPDNARFGWLKRKPDFHDIPCEDIVLTGQNFESEDPFVPGGSAKTSTGAFVAFKTKTTPNQKIEGRVPCNGAILRMPAAGGTLEVFAWGFRNPFGLAFSADGKLFVTENGYDERGSRPVWGAGDVLWQVEKGRWYGWPDFSAGEPLTDDQYKPPGDPALQFLLAQYPDTPPYPVAIFGVHSSSNGLDFSRNDAFGYKGEAFVAQFGDQAPAVGKLLSPVGYKVVRVELRRGPQRGIIEDFAANKGYDNGPASLRGTGGLERPVAVRFDPAGTALYIVDFGVLLQEGKKTVPKPGTGVLWKITRGS